MKKNEYILKKWEKYINTLPKYNLNQAKQIYKDYLAESDEEKRKAIRKDLILGTLYVVYNHIKSYNYVSLVSTYYDMNDIISACNEKWINAIDSGKLLKAKFFSFIFDEVFYKKVTEDLIGKEHSIKYRTVLNYDNFAQAFLDFVQLKEQHGECVFEEFVELINRKYSSDSKNDTSRAFFIKNTYLLFEKIYKNFVEKCNGDKFTVSKIVIFKYLILHNAVRENIMSLDNISESKLMEDEVVDNLIIDELLCSAFESLDADEVDILCRRHGIGVYDKQTESSIAELYNFSRTMVYLKELKAFEKIKNSRKLKKYLAGFKRK